MKAITTVIFILIISLPSFAFQKLDSIMPVRGLCIAAPHPDGVDNFTRFMKKELGNNNINTLILRVDYKYEYKSYPNLRSEDPLTEKDVKKLVKAAENAGIRLIPQINLFGHQSWHSKLSPLLVEYPEFDETPHVELPDEYEWPNEDGLYCKSYCPLHPEVHDVVFALVDEIMEVFEADAFHAGLDEVFYIGDDKCPRCSGRDKAELFAGEVQKIRNHLALNGHDLWIWGDRLIDGKTTGLGMWEASMNNTHRAVDMIPKDVMICDWHYERADPTAAYFAMKGLNVVTCPWRRPAVTQDQIDQFLDFQQVNNPVLRERYQGFLQTVWGSAESFIAAYEGENSDNESRAGSAESFKLLIERIDDLE